MDDWLNEADEEEWDVNADSPDGSSGGDFNQVEVGVLTDQSMER